MAGALILAGLIWFACIWMLEPISGIAVSASRVLFALKCCAVAILLTFLTGAEAASPQQKRICDLSIRIDCLIQ